MIIYGNIIHTVSQKWNNLWRHSVHPWKYNESENPQNCPDCNIWNGIQDFTMASITGNATDIDFRE